MFRRPTLDEVLLAVFAIVVFAAVQLSSDSGSGVLPPEAEETPTSKPQAAVPASTATPSAIAASVAATPTVTAPPSAIAAPGTATPTAAATPSATDATTKDPNSCDFRDELERVRGAVVRIRSVTGPSRGSEGTGFHIGEGMYVTAAHVVLDDSGNTLRDIRVESALTGRSEPAEVVRVGSFSSSASNQQRDLAVLRAPPIEHSIGYRAPTEDDVERDVRALGYPWSQAQDDSARIPPPVVLKGILSSTAERNTIGIVQSDVRVQSGMSGGPLVDECGDALAVAASLPRMPGGAVGEGIGVFISMAELDKLR